MGTETGPEIVVASYNVLADAYIRPQYYPRCNPAHFAAKTRHAGLAARAAGLGADVVCLQEVDGRMYASLDTHLTPLGYDGRFAQKRRNKPDGCATFVRAPWTVAEAGAAYYHDGPDGLGSGHLAQFILLERDGRKLEIVNTHLKWDPPEAKGHQRVGYGQTIELLSLILRRGVAPRIVCGDFNAEPDGDQLRLFTGLGYADAHPATAFTCNSNGRAKKIDFLLHSPDLAARPLPTPPVADDTPLPSESEPSDHVPLIAALSFIKA